MLCSISFASFIFINVTIYYCLYLDIKYRIIPNKVFSCIYAISLILSLISLIYFYKELGLILVNRIYMFIEAFFLSFFLFWIKIIGGSDGKLIIFIFITESFYDFHFLHVYIYFLIFCGLYLITLVINYIFNSNSPFFESFELLCGIFCYYSCIKKIFFKSSFNFLSFSKMRDLRPEKYDVKSILLFHNIKSGEFHILVQIRKPLILVCIGSYYFLILFTYLNSI